MDKELLKYLSLDPSLIDYTIGVDEWSPDERVYVFTGKGTRSELFHLGHYYLWSVISQLSNRLNLKVVFQISGDEKRNSPNGYMKLRTIDKLVAKTVNDVNLLSWRDFLLFSNTNSFNTLILKNSADYIASNLSLKKLSQVFGDLSLDLAYYTCVQLAPLLLLNVTFLPNYRPIIITSGDQIGYFQICRDLCHKLNLKKPILIVIKSILDLKMKNKMSTSDPSNAVPFTEIGLQKIRKGFSDQDGSKDFTIHVIQKFSKLPLHEGLKDYMEEYKSTRSTKNLKDQCVNYFKQLLNKDSGFKLSTVLPVTLQIEQLMRDLEDKYVKKENKVTP